jgi:hypothetical protein
MLANMRFVMQEEEAPEKEESEEEEEEEEEEEPVDPKEQLEEGESIPIRPFDLRYLTMRLNLFI